MLKEELRALEKAARVIISSDKVEAYLEFTEDISEYTVDNVVELLNHHNVTYGIDKTRIAVMLNEREAYVRVLVAKGTAAVKGTNGYYKYYFNTEPFTGTIILEDGTVDYNVLGEMVLCHENDLLVEYHPAVPGTTGVSVSGTVLQPPPVKELKPIRGKGFTVKEGENCYYSDFDGKIDFDGTLLKVSQLYVVEGDLDSNAKPIGFCGDVLVQGNVFAGARIETVGNITVNGHVESSTLLAGKNILLRNGMQGDGSGYVFAKGNISAKFLENTTVVSNGNIFSNYILNCDIYANKKVIVSGQRGAIIGGHVRAIEAISASVVGNTAHLQTQMEIGVGTDFYYKYQQVEDSVNKLKEEISELEQKLNRICEKIKTKPSPLLLNIRSEVLKEKIEKTAKYNEQCRMKEELMSQKKRSVSGNIVVAGRVFPNTYVRINGVSSIIHDIYRNITFLNKESEIRIYSNIWEENAVQKSMNVNK
ncbi:DUF342 domain-containing protein [Konateibacter massiliensis]|uniref:DUF342 domain-containing protein n=1 Tax=Konateibacter massiliensis TaxID=2002841 RepID=UPI000C151F4F|nr:FapA family protein [Konateibacter massiliensis]